MSSIEVSNISAQTTEKEIRDFFSFCGKISQLSVKANEKTQVANVTFEKDAAAKTALLLDNTELGGAVVRVAQATTSGPTAQADKPKESTSAVDDPIAQEDKPRTRILAEYMAHGYVVSDNVIDKAINLDSQYGVSKTFMGMLKKVDENLAVTGRAQNLDSTYNISGRAAAGWRGLNSYVEQASQTPTGRRFRAFYDEGQKQVLDVHAEAKHLAMLKQGKQPDSGLHNIGGTDRTQCNCGADTTNCPCAPGACACNSCAKNPDTETTKVTPAEAQLKEVKVDGQNKTTCNCGGADNKCPCEPGKCTCNGCSKSS